MKYEKTTKELVADFHKDLAEALDARENVHVDIVGEYVCVSVTPGNWRNGRVLDGEARDALDLLAAYQEVFENIDGFAEFIENRLRFRIFVY